MELSVKSQNIILGVSFLNKFKGETKMAIFSSERTRLRSIFFEAAKKFEIL